MKKISIVVFFLSHLTAAYGAVVMNDAEVREVSISAKGLTRLSVKGEIIQDIFVYPMNIGEIALSEVVQLHKSGHVFIASHGVKEPFYLTLITGKGHVQDLRLIPSSDKSQPLILEIPKDSDQLLIVSNQLSAVSKKALEVALQGALQGIQPVGFEKIASSHLSLRSLGVLLLTEKVAYQSSDHLLKVFEIENRSDKEITLLPEMFLEKDDLAIVFDKSVLPAAEKTLLAVLTPCGVFLPNETSSLTDSIPARETFVVSPKAEQETASNQPPSLAGGASLAFHSPSTT